MPTSAPMTAPTHPAHASAPPHAQLPPSTWITRFAPLLETCASACGTRHALDVACGYGRHARWLHAHGWHVTAVDHDGAALDTLTDLEPGVRRVQADIEADPWPLPGERFSAIIVTHYLWRPLWPTLLASLADGGVLLVETFAQGQETVGRPRRSAFLLAPGELLQVCAPLRVVAYEDGYLSDPPRFIQRIAAVRARTDADRTARYPLP
ncbi:class I SAM-dependent methyltransferase [Tepidimonas charontis]|uniref:Methyltransferase domain protein n=1 Tax=Tepidimonas charontis TaxID=2267262 RepID=A0A554X6F2_9BURK|nr:class I SAM-dependent methyltransferase [Tepidimonas charontis]TSE31403.1 Methyltransferase domain protein [Tepidimonas charontis]